MATEVCDCGGTCSMCNPKFDSDGIRIEITLQGRYHRGSKWSESFINGAMSSFYIPGEGCLSKKDQRKIVAKIAKALKMKPYHSI